MFQKGKTKLCLYGLGSIRDERLHRMFLDGKVSMLRPRENCDEWFNVMVLHQNRAKHGAKNYIPEQFLDNFLDLIVWGHEHECRIDQEWNGEQAFYVTQPGSSVATSLCHGEAVSKHVGILQVRGKEFQINKIPLQTVRQFYIKDVDLEDISLNLNEPDSCEKVMDYCRELVDQFLQKAEEEHTGNSKQPTQPLIRLRVFYPSNFDTFSVQRFGHSYVSKVANSKDIILFSRKKAERAKAAEIDSDMLKTILKQEGFDKKRVEDLVKKYFEQTDENKRLLVLSEVGVSFAVQEYVEKEVKEAIVSLVEHQAKKTETYLKQNVEDSSVIDEELLKFREERRKNSEKESSEFQSVIKSTGSRTQHNSSDIDDDLMNDETVEIPVPKTRGRGRGRGSRGGRGASTSTRANTSTKRNTRTAAPKADVQENGGKRRRTTASSRNASRQTDLSSYFHNGTNDCMNISDDDSDEQESKRRKTASKRTAGR
ncbi:Double-strand break repair protein MRE11A, partial [Stegodyphus mimosarum]